MVGPEDAGGYGRRLYEHARQLMPWGTQTNAKRPDPAFLGVMPLLVERAEGCRFQDVEGRWYLDYRSALGAVLLGYRHPAVDAAVRAQLDRGVLFSMASPLEADVAERLVGLIPGLAQVRFMKTGHEANAAAIRLARAFTGRDHLITCGYHGHSDWFACGDGPPDPRRARNGVPAALDALVTRVPYGDTAAAGRAFAAHGSRVAAMIMVPYDWGADVAHGFVHRMRALSEQHGALLIFDQVLTGFRLATGGAQEYFGVMPDLTTYAKALANGHPLSVLGGRQAVMARLEDLLITTTHGGEALSLAAARATLDVLREEPVVEHVWRMGRRLAEGFDAAAAACGLAARSYGLPPAVRFRFSRDAVRDVDARRAFFRELYRQGVFAADPFLLTYAHQPADIDETLMVMEKALMITAATVPGLDVPREG